MKILCMLFGLWCPTNEWAWHDKIITGPTVYDVVINVPPCVPGEDYTPAINRALRQAEVLNETMAPPSDAAIFSEVGALVAVKVPGGTCNLSSPILLGNRAITLVFDDEGTLVFDGGTMTVSGFDLTGRPEGSRGVRRY